MEETQEQKSANFFKLIRLLVDIGAEVLRDVLLNEIPQTQLAAVIQQNNNLLQELRRRKVLTDPQWDLLQEQPPDPAKFDISLLVALLRNICTKIAPPSPNWRVEIPDVNDHSIGAELLRIRNIRNRNLHVANSMMPKSLFTPLWKELVGIITRISIQVSPEVTVKVVGNIGKLENYKIDPNCEKEKKFLKVFQDWQTQITDIVEEKIASLQSSMTSLQVQNETISDVVDAVRQAGDATNETLATVQRQLSQVAQDVFRMSSPIQVASGDHAPAEARPSDFKEIQQELQTVKKDLAFIKLHIQAFTSKPQGTTQSVGQDTAIQCRSSQPSRELESTGDLSIKDIDKIASNIGSDWEHLARFLDYRTGQIESLKEMYREKPISRNIRLIQSWSVVVSQCGESPRTLLAAAFATIRNNEMAQSLVHPEEVEGIKDLEAKSETKKRIQEINFEGGSQGPIQVVAMGGEGAINVFDGDVTLGSLSIISSLTDSNSTKTLPDRLSLQSIRSSGLSSLQIGGQGSLNIHGGNVKMQKGQTAHIGTSGPLITDAPDICRAEGVDSPDSLEANESNFKKTRDNCLDEATMNELLQRMKSVGALICFDQQVGTVFRAGSKYVITAAHCVHSVIDPMKTGFRTWSNLNHPSVLISFDHPIVQQNQLLFQIKEAAYYNVGLDVAILELTDPSKLPPRLTLCSQDVNVEAVNIIGYGHPHNLKKQVDPSCEVISPMNPLMNAAQAWIEQNKGRLCGAVKQKYRDSMEWSFVGYDKKEKIIFNCYLEQGASGAPILCTTSLSKPIAVVIGMVTNGLPHCFWNLSSLGQLMFPSQYRFEMGTRISSLYQDLIHANSALANDLFQQ